MSNYKNKNFLRLSALTVIPFLSCVPGMVHAEESVETLLRLVEDQQKSLREQQEQINQLSKVVADIKPVEVEKERVADADSKASVDFYGILDVSISNTDSGHGSKTTIGSGGFAASRFGVSLKHKTNDAFDVIAKAEAGLLLDTGVVGNAGIVPGTSHSINNDAQSSSAHGSGPQIFAREAYAGIQGDFGRITIGRQYSGSYAATAVIGSAKSDGLYGYSGSIIPRVGFMPTRVNNSIVYVTPKYKGFHAQLLATTGSENNVANDVEFLNGGESFTTNDKAGRGADLAIFYSTEKFKGAVTTWRLKNSSYRTNGETGLATLEGWMIAGNYNFGPIIGYATYANGEISGGNYENVTQYLSKSDAWALSALLPIGSKHNFLASFTDFDDKSSLNQDAKLVGLGYWYNFDESTLFYTTWGKVINDSGSSYSLADGGNLVGRTESPGVDHSGFMAGINYKF